MLEGQREEVVGDTPLRVRGLAGIAPAVGTPGWGALCPVPGENVTRGCV